MISKLSTGTNGFKSSHSCKYDMQPLLYPAMVLFPQQCFGS